MPSKMFIVIIGDDFAKGLALLEKENVSFTLEDDTALTLTFKDMGEFRKAILLFQDNKINFR